MVNIVYAIDVHRAILSRLNLYIISDQLKILFDRKRNQIAIPTEQIKTIQTPKIQTTRIKLASSIMDRVDMYPCHEKKKIPDNSGFAFFLSKQHKCI